MNSPWPYEHHGLVEIPVQWLLDDGPYYLISFHPPNYRQLFPPSAVLRAWKDELRGIHELGGVLTLTLHPQLTGRPSRLAALEELIDYARTLTGVRLPTLGELATACAGTATRPDP